MKNKDSTKKYYLKFVSYLFAVSVFVLLAYASLVTFNSSFWRAPSHERKKSIKANPKVSAKRDEIDVLRKAKDKKSKLLSAKKLLSMLKDECINPTSTRPLSGKYFTETILLKTQYMYAMQHLGSDIIPVLKEAINDKHDEFRKRVMIVLGYFKDKSVFRKLITIMLEDEDWNLRECAAYALHFYDDPKSFEPLEKALKDPYCEPDESDRASEGDEICPVRQAAFTSLLELGFRRVPPFGCPPICSKNVYIMRKLSDAELAVEKKRDKEGAQKLKEHLAKSVDELMSIMRSGVEPGKSHAMGALILKGEKLSKEQFKELQEELKKRVNQK